MLHHLNRFATAVFFLLALASPFGVNAQEREPFQQQVGFNITEGNTSNLKYFYLTGATGSATDLQCGSSGCIYTYRSAPTNKRVVIESVSGTARLPTGQMVEIAVGTVVCTALETGGQTCPQVPHPFVPVNKVPGAKDWYVFNQVTKLYASPGFAIYARAMRSETNGIAEIRVNISGYLETVTP